MRIAFLAAVSGAMAVSACATQQPGAPVEPMGDTLRILPCSQGRAPRLDEVSYTMALLDRLGSVPQEEISEFSEVIDGIAYPPPQPTYPIEAAIAGREGACRVHFNLTAEGRTAVLGAACSDPVFVDAAEAAVAEARFPPAIVDGAPAPRDDLVYPLTFCTMRQD